MQTGTTPLWRAAAEPPSDRSTSGTGTCPRTPNRDRTARDGVAEVAA
ncbi:hypothetical protein [Halorubrum tebenquichense]|nr:hypothetical protein [Halorubrum tebenquichense]